MIDPQGRLERAAEELCLAMRAAERAGYDVRVDLDWQPGLSAGFQFTRCYRANLWINGVHLEIAP